MNASARAESLTWEAHLRCHSSAKMLRSVSLGRLPPWRGRDWGRLVELLYELAKGSNRRGRCATVKAKDTEEARIGRVTDARSSFASGL
jgi:hypothetical protein